MGKNRSFITSRFSKVDTIEDSKLQIDKLQFLKNGSRVQTLALVLV